MTAHEPFLDTIRAHQNQAEPLLVYADWLAERGYWWAEQAMRARAWSCQRMHWRGYPHYWTWTWQWQERKPNHRWWWEVRITPCNGSVDVELHDNRCEDGVWLAWWLWPLVMDRHPGRPWTKRKRCIGEPRDQRFRRSYHASPPAAVVPLLAAFYAKLLKSKSRKKPHIKLVPS